VRNILKVIGHRGTGSTVRWGPRGVTGSQWEVPLKYRTFGRGSLKNDRLCKKGARMLN